MENNPQFPWYSSLTTGILEVDIQHGNIDIMMQLLENSPIVDTGLLDQILLSIENHFHYEQQLLEDDFPKDHLQAHKDFLSFYKYEEIELRTKVIAKDFFIRIIRNKLKEHVETYDSLLKKLLAVVKEKE